MPESRSRKKAKSSQPNQPRTTSKAPEGNPRWLVPVMVGLMVLGLVWVVTTYITAPSYYPIPALEQWNLAIGFTLIIAGFVLTTRWR